ncbi:MAG: TniQ family protein [Nereida ignava]
MKNAIQGQVAQHNRNTKKPVAIGTLPLIVPMGDHELATSLASRVAALNGAPKLRQFCKETAVSYLDLCNGDVDAVKKIARLSAADSEKLLFQTPRLLENGWFRLGYERLKFTTMLRSGGQICPLCIADDRAVDERFGPYQRAAWQVAAFRRCPTHNTLFERPQFAFASNETFDFSRMLKHWKSTTPVCVEQRYTEYEEYLTQRLWQKPTSHWIDAQAFHVVWQMSEALGLLLTKGPNSKPQDESAPTLINAADAGFAVLSLGPQALIKALADIRDEAGSDRSAYGKLYRPLMSCLRERRDDAEFDIIRQLVREFIRDNFYIPSDTSLLGEICDHPRIHTVLTASKFFDVPTSLLSRRLRKNGLIPKGQPNNVSNRNLLIHSSQIERLVDDVKKLSSITVVRALFGVDRYLMERLCHERILEPYFGDDGGMPVYHVDEVMDFVKKLNQATRHMENPTHEWNTIPIVAARCHCSTAWIIRQVFDGKLELVSELSEPFMLNEFLVSIEHVKALLIAIPEGKVTVADAATMLGIDIKTVHALAESGLLSSEMSEFRLANRLRRLLDKSDLEAFARDYIPLAAPSKSCKSLFEDWLAFLAKNGAEPLEFDGGTKLIFVRADITRIAYHSTCNSAMQQRLMRILDADGAQKLKKSVFKTPKKIEPKPSNDSRKLGDPS